MVNSTVKLLTVRYQGYYAQKRFLDTLLAGHLSPADKAQAKATELQLAHLKLQLDTKLAALDKTQQRCVQEQLASL